ncbi:MAG: DUF4406 domain-containing protein [Microthrixaceae bacterium]
MTTTKLYLAGPMRGCKEFNFPTFRRGRQRLRAAGYDVFCPAERDEESGFDPTGMEGTTEELERTGFDLRQALSLGTEFICEKADGIAVLDGWERSSGARAEVALAEALGLPVQTVSDWVDAGRTPDGWVQRAIPGAPEPKVQPKDVLRTGLVQYARIANERMLRALPVERLAPGDYVGGREVESVDVNVGEVWVDWTTGSGNRWIPGTLVMLDPEES